ncbi:hypothetical protein DN069_25190 [Streptacidiphilus pinicola]|uniref:Uncharacterized protein n=1 Tax=Streptacidiphilus pinicola TaxID=2219663 RepID=A0A2X0IGW9_9ACTN|nr:hypothetical protein DN069_25190 [Streptacidiphilus pinicola]
MMAPGNLNTTIYQDSAAVPPPPNGAPKAPHYPAGSACGRAYRGQDRRRARRPRRGRHRRGARSGTVGRFGTGLDGRRRLRGTGRG